MMNPFICKTLISLYLKNSLHVRKPPITYSISLHFFSTSSSRSKSKISLADYLINQHSFSPEAALKVSYLQTHLKNPEKLDSILSFLKESGFSDTRIEIIVRRTPKILSSSLDRTIKPKIKILQDLGLSSTDIVEILTADPWFLTRSVKKVILPSISVLKSVLGSNADFGKIIKRGGWFLKLDLEKTLIPNIEILKGCGIASSQIVRFIRSFPRLFLHKPDGIRNFVKRVDEMGFDRKSRMYLPAIRVISSMNKELWERKVNLFKRLGYSDDHILSIFRSTPQVFSTSEKKIEGITKLLLQRGNVDISLIADNPVLLLCSIEHRLKPRLEVFDLLTSKNLIQKEISLVTIFMTCETKFIQKYVLPYSDELGKLMYFWLEDIKTMNCNKDLNLILGCSEG
ncbi:uncharacterized protein LOC116131570 [Pistacia vera]|uniref:uncharacterized protein LOC116131570 n=1 Tax=Pistacia vera TaxID=55513 RepID=UPI001263CD43|nr:uncharacterized protein LOC116131570 [Pistacia vera]